MKWRMYIGKENPSQIFALLYFLKNADDESIPFLSVEINFKKREQNYHKFYVNHFSLCLNYYTRTFICIEVIDRRKEVVTIAQQFIFSHADGLLCMQLV